MPLLTNSRHERFAQLVAGGMSATAAYRQAGYLAKDADTAGPRLSGNVGIKARIAEIKGIAANATVLTIAEKREFLRRVVVTPIGEINAQSDLCHSIEHTNQGSKIKAHDKLRAIELDAKLAGEFTEAAKGVNINITNTVGVVMPSERLNALQSAHRATAAAFGKS